MSTLPDLIGLASPAPGCGKTTVAGFLQQHGYRRLSFAGPLKRMAIVLFEELGYSPSDASDLVHEHKELRLPGINTTPRHVLRTLGTEYGRQCIHPDLWLMCAGRALSALRADGHRVVFDDCRFPNEAEFIRTHGGALWRVERPGVVCQTDHASEGGLDDFIFDRRIVNDGSVLDLYQQMQALQPD